MMIAREQAASTSSRIWVEKMIAFRLAHSPDQRSDFMFLVGIKAVGRLVQDQKHEMRTLIREMGKTKAIIFSTHILEEVEAACSRAIIIDRSRIVANGTPDQLNVTRNTRARCATIARRRLPLVRQKLNQISVVEKTVVFSDEPFAIRAYAKGNGAPREVARAISALALSERWKIEELHTEEGGSMKFSGTLRNQKPAKRFRMSEAVMENPTDLTESSATNKTSRMAFITFGQSRNAK